MIPSGNGVADDQCIKIVFLEDLPTDVELAEREFKKNGIRYESIREETESAFLAALDSFDPDVVISDYSMPLFNGMRALLLAKEIDPFLPFVILTGSMNEDTAVACMKAGASDYVIKEHLARLPFAVREAIERRKIQKKAAAQEELLHQSEERYRSIFANSNAVMLIIDPSDNSIQDANEAASDFYGWPKAALIGKRMEEINTLSPEAIRELIRKAVAQERKYFQFKHRKADGTIVDVEVHSGPIAIGEKIYLLSIIHDISQRIAVQEERDALALKLSHYLSTSPTITYSLRLEDGSARWEWISENVVGILGYSLDEVLEANWWFRNVYAADRAFALKGIAELTKRERYSQEYRFTRKDRTAVWLRDDMRLVRNESGALEIVGTLTDITERKVAEAEISLKSAALEAADNAVVITDRDGFIEWANTAFERLTGYSLREAIGKNPHDLVKSGEQDASFYSALWDDINSGKVWRGELVNKKKSGELYQEEMTITPVMDASRRLEHFIAIKSDVTERTRAKENMEASLREKEVLLREIHHRVKNNMQVISSLLTLSERGIGDPALSRVFEEVERRIQAMAIVHDQFYESEDLARIDFSMNLHQLASSLIDDSDASGKKPELVFDAEEIRLTLEASIPAGLIVSEFVSNALRFAFVRDDRPGMIKIALRPKDDGNLEIEVRDNGIGLSDGFDPKTAQTLGMQLIGILTEQLNGTVSFFNDGGTVAVLRFPFPIRPK